MELIKSIYEFLKQLQSDGVFNHFYITAILFTIIIMAILNKVYFNKKIKNDNVKKQKVIIILILSCVSCIFHIFLFKIKFDIRLYIVNVFMFNIPIAIGLNQLYRIFLRPILIKFNFIKEKKTGTPEMITRIKKDTHD